MIDAKVKLHPIKIPNYVISTEARGGRRDHLRIAIKDIDRESIEGLCDQFKKDMLEAAGYDHVEGL